jgi:hypothetical protein
VDVLFALINDSYNTIEPHSTDPLYHCMVYLSIDPGHETPGCTYQSVGHIAYNFSAMQWVLHLAAFARIHHLQRDHQASTLSSNPTVEEIQQAVALADQQGVHPNTLKTTEKSSFGLLH